MSIIIQSLGACGLVAVFILIIVQLRTPREKALKQGWRVKEIERLSKNAKGQISAAIMEAVSVKLPLSNAGSEAED